MRPLPLSSAADWVAAGTDHWKLTIEGFVPGEYEAYARVLHEVERGDGHDTWSSVAAANGRPFGPLAQWTRINVDAHGHEWPSQPRAGTLTPSAARALSDVLGTFTSTPETCFFGVWEGFGGGELPSGIQLFESHRRVMGLFEGAIQDASHSFSWPGFQLANLWWPTDRAWFIVSEIDYDSTIIAGSQECIDALLDAPGLEVFEVSPADTLAIS